MKIKLLLMSVLFGGLLQSQVVVFSDSFENPTVVDGAYRPSGWSWNALTTSGLVESGTGFNLPFGLVQDGTQAAFVQQTGSFDQSISLSGGAADTYTLSFYYTGRDVAGAGDQSFQVSLDGVSIYSGLSVSNQNWTFVTTDFVKAAGTYNLKFEGFSTADQTVFLDNLVVTTAVPEPNVSVFGFCLLFGFMIFFKKRNSRVSIS
jgi:hypothetical protein